MVYFFYRENISAEKEQDAKRLLESQGYTEMPACKESFSHRERGIISLGFDQRRIQTNPNEKDLTTYLQDFQELIDELRSICNITSYQTDFDGPIPQGLKLEGLLKKE